MDPYQKVRTLADLHLYQADLRERLNTVEALLKSPPSGGRSRALTRLMTDRQTQLALELTGLNAAIGWLRDLRQACVDNRLEQAMGSGAFEFTDPKRPCADCDLASPENPELLWFHTHHRVYNRVARSIIADEYGIGRLRGLLANEANSSWKETAHIGDAGPFGPHLLKSYASALLANFASDAATARWC